MKKSQTNGAITQYKEADRNLSRLMGSSLSSLGVKVNRLKHQLKDVSGAVTGMALNDDESLIYASTRTGTIKVVSRETWKCVRTFTGHTWWVSDVAFCNNIIASAGADKTVRLWDPNGNCLDVLKSNTDVVTAVAFNQSGTLLASAGRDGRVYIWRKNQSGRWLLERTFSGHKEWVLSICFSDDVRLISAGFDGALLWDAISGEILAGLSEPFTEKPAVSVQGPFDYIRNNRVIALNVHCAGSYAMIGHSHNHATVWNVKTGKQVRKLNGSGSAFCVRMNNEDSMNAVGWEYDYISVFKNRNQITTNILKGHTDWPLALLFTSEGNLISGSMDSTIREWNISQNKEISAYRGKSRAICDIALKAGNLTVGGQDNAVSIYDLASGEKRSVYTNLNHWVNVVTFSPDAKMIAAGTIDGDALLVDAATGKLIAFLSRRDEEIVRLTQWPGWNPNEISSLAFSSDGSFILVGTRCGIMSLHDVKTRTKLREYNFSPTLIHHIKFLCKDTEFLASCWDGIVYRGDIAYGKILSTYKPPLQNIINHIEVSRISGDGRFLITISFDGFVRIYNYHSTEMISAFKAHPGRIRSAALRGDVLATGGLDACIKVWNWKKQSLMHCLTDSNDSITALHFTAGGERLVSGSRDGTVRFFSCKHDYKLLATLYNMTGKDWFWETPDGWFYTNRPSELLDVLEISEDGCQRTILRKTELCVLNYLTLHNNYNKIKGAVMGGLFQEQSDRFDRLVAAHRNTGYVTRRLGPGNKSGDTKENHTTTDK